MSNTYTTKKGSVLPLMKLKGKDYLLIAHRLVWLNDESDNFTINTEILKLSDENAVIKSTVSLYDKEGRIVKSATATKQESKKDFPDFIEKAETGSVGRCLALLGFGTNFAIQDLDEGNRLADAPLETPSKPTAQAAPVASPQESSAKKSSFRKPAPKQESSEEEWEG